MPDRRCTPKAKSTGNRCRRRPIIGGTVCKVQGGGAPQVQRTARQRLAELAAPAVGVLATSMAKAMAKGDWSAAVRAAVEVLDRSGYGVASQIHRVDLSALSDDQLDALGRGEDPLTVLAQPQPQPMPMQPPRPMPPPPPPVEDDDEEVAL